MPDDTENIRNKYAAGSTEQTCPPLIRGMDFLLVARLNKGLAFSLQDRQLIGIHGLLPPRQKTEKEQTTLCMKQLARFEDPLNKYIYLMGIGDINERLFFKLLSENLTELMPIVYTPTVGLACQKYGLIYQKPRGMFITIHDKGHIYDILCNWPENDIRAIVVTDGARILGLGDLGAQGMGIPVGKLALYTVLGGIKPHQCIPITIDVGTNNQELLEDEDYIGLRQPRVKGKEYDDLIDEFMRSVVMRYGQKTLIQFEDFGNDNAFVLLEKYKNSYCTFNDDIQGTASVAVAGILAALKATGTKLSEHTFLFLGAGEAALGIADLLAQAMAKNEGLSREDALNKLFMRDSKGLIVHDRPEGGVTEHKMPFAKHHKPMKDLAEIIGELRPTMLIGASAQGGAFTPEIISQMASINKQPIIFALSNPTSKAECTAEAAYTHSEGRALFASGSPFPNFEMNGKKFEPGQGNNAYIFPGIALGIICAGVYHIMDDVFLTAAETLADMVTENDIAVGRLFPPLDDIKKCSVKIALKIVEEAYANGYASVYPEPEDKEIFIMSQMYDYSYDNTSALPTVYPWPKL